MEERTEVVRVLNGLLTTELRAINQYFLDSKLAGHWGFERLAHHFRHDSFEEMRDAEALADRILLLGGLPNFQRMDAFATVETVPEQLAAAAQLESGAIGQLGEAIRTCDRVGDEGTAQLLRTMLLDEELQLDWLTTQLDLIEVLGEANYLAQQVHE